MNEETGSGWTEHRLARAAGQLLIVSLAVAAIIYFMRKYSADISSVRQLTWQSILHIAVWSFASYTTYAYAVYVVLVELGLKNLRPTGWIKIYFVSRIVNLLVLQGGNLYRLIILKKMYGFSYTNSVGVTVFLIWVNAFIALLASVVALATFEEEINLKGISLMYWCTGLLIVATTVPFVATFSSRMLSVSALQSFGLVQSIRTIAEFFAETIRKRKFFTKVAALSAAHFLLFVGVNYVSFAAIGWPLEVPVVCLFTTAFVFTRYINIVPGNLGISELIGGLVSEHLGVGFGNGLVVAGIVRIVEVLMIVLAGLVYGKVALLEYLSDRKSKEGQS